MLKSSIIGKEFVNYRKITDKDKRSAFSGKIRSQGLGYIPIVVDSVDSELSLALSSKDPNYSRSIKYGFELSLHMDRTVNDLIKQIKIEFLKKDKEALSNGIVLGLEDGTILDSSIVLGDIYKDYRNKDDKILYVLATKETSVFDYILSIIKYLTRNVVRYFKKEIL